MRINLRGFALLPVVAMVLAGCGDARNEDATMRRPTASTPEPPALEAPSIRLHLGSGPVDLEPWTACYGNGCYDGSPPKDLLDVGRADAVELSFAREGWTFDATFREAGAVCPRQITVPTTKVSANRFRVDPAGRAGTWDVDVFGRGPGGDVITTFRWRTDQPGAFPDTATSTLAVLADHDGTLDSYGIELGVSDLARTPETASATVTVVASDGRRAVIDLGPMPRECSSAGQIFWSKPASAAGAATALSGTVFRYVVLLTLDGVEHTGRATWPTDTNGDIAPAVSLTWTPELPAYRG
jgi:hypothetical protein